MKILPNLCTAQSEVPAWIVENYLGSVAVQLSSTDWDYEISKLQELLNKLPPTYQLCVHIPFELARLSYVLGRPGRERHLLYGLAQLRHVAASHRADLRCIMHIDDTVQKLNTLGLVEEFLSKALTTSANLRWENEMIDLCSMSPLLPSSFAFLREFKSQRGCFDICHAQSSIYVTHHQLEITAADFESIDTIHFACALNHDGWLDKANTHGRKHLNHVTFSSDCDRLFNVLKDSSSLWVVVEVSEKDYKLRPDQMQEYFWLMDWREEHGYVR